MQILHHRIIAVWHNCLKCFLLILFLGAGKNMYAQCPPNLDFEQGSFAGWECWIGHAYVNGNENEIVWDVPPANTPVDPRAYRERFRMLSAFPGDGLDFFGQFPVNCPNGSGKSIKLGNTEGGAEAEGVSYTFTIPAGQNKYNLIYNYAVVFQGPVHNDWQQPRMVIEILNVTDNKMIDCSSFNFHYSTSSPTLPGFFLSTTNNTGTPVWCKDWSANSIKLDGLAGKTIRLFFKTADCTFQVHFGYAYIDVNTECSSSFTGATYCPDDAFIEVTAPFGYENYTWWDAGFTTILGNAQTINFTPPPASGTTIAVELDPYEGFGCKDTLYANLLDTLTIQSIAGPDQLSCNNTPVQLGANSRPGLRYRWNPTTGLNNSRIANPVATVSGTTEYILTTTNAGGGCATNDTVLVTADVIDNSLELVGPAEFCFNDITTTTLKVLAADSIQWYQDNIAIPGANLTEYRVLQSGAYHAILFKLSGCSLSTDTLDIIVKPAPVADFDINDAAQCLTGNAFVFTNNSIITTGTLQYFWNLGDGNTSTDIDVNHSYASPGIYQVKLLVVSDEGCKDSISFAVEVNENPVADFSINANEQCFKNNQFVFTNNSTLSSGTMQYLWQMGDGNTVTTRDVTYHYTLPGVYTISLLTTSDKGCTDSYSFDVTVNPGPVANFSVADAQQCFTNNRFNFINNSNISSGTLQYAWDLGDGTLATTRDVTHSYAQSGDYLVRLIITSDKTCVDSFKLDVKVFPFALADFDVESKCVNLILPITNKTINNTATTLNYLWDFGNGHSTTVQNPVYSYPAPGAYTVKLSVNTNQCPQPLTVMEIDVVIESPQQGIRYPDKVAVMNFSEPLQARSIGNAVLWMPSTNLDFPSSYTPNFKGLYPQLYSIQLKTDIGCITTDTQYVKTRKKIEIYVPNSFTPDGNGLNEYLRPYLMGFNTVTFFRVYNRWGKLLYQMQSDTPGWDGRINGQKQDMQTVVWMIEAIDVDGVTHKRQGTSILIR